MHLPKDLARQLNEAERKIAHMPDAKSTDFLEPFDNASNLGRMSKAIWVKSESLGKAFKFCTATRKIVEHSIK